MEKIVGYVVANKKGSFYVNNKRFTNDLQKAKEFNSLATAKKVANICDGVALEVIVNSSN